jgi:leader peptidase (prepilin peptidase)/N-methyltransferase
LIIIFVLYVILGWLIGVMINHAADLLPARQSLIRQPACAECGAPRPRRQWSALLMAISGQLACRQCGAQRSRLIRSIVVELVTPLMFAYLLWRYGLSLKLGLVSLYSTVLLLITVTDLEHRLIFNIIILPAILAAIIAAFITPDLSWRAAIVGGVFAFVVVYVAVWLSRGGLGEGDLTLSTFLGFILGFPHIILSLTFGVFLGGLVAFLLLVSGRVGMKTFIPYGPFLTLTGWLMLVWGDEIWAYYFW